MKVIDLALYFYTKNIFKNAIRDILTDQLPKEIVFSFSKDIWKKYNGNCVKLKKQKTLGATIMVRYSFLTQLIYEKLISKGIEKEKAMKLTSEITWSLYDKITNRFWLFTRLFSKEPILRVKKAMGFFINYFPYKSPGYKMKILNTNKNEVAFNVYKCPAAEFFKDQGLSELCSISWCDLDYPLADNWNVKLERDKTIAKGFKFCNFKFLSNEY